MKKMIETNFMPGNGDNVRIQPRQMIRLLHTLAYDPRLSLITWDEVLLRVNTTPASGQAGFNQNRAFFCAFVNEGAAPRLTNKVRLCER